VLVVEDDAAIRSMLTAALVREPLLVDSAADGVGALEKLAVESYAVIVVDLMMPRMDGFTFLDNFRTLAFSQQRPLVFVMTAYDDAALVKLDGTLVHGSFKKPFDIESVVTVVREAAHTLHGHNERAAGPGAALSDDAAPNVC
jgi:DNA-binding response OmpR family regulator